MTTEIKECDLPPPDQEKSSISTDQDDYCVKINNGTRSLYNVDTTLSTPIKHKPVPQDQQLKNGSTKDLNNRFQFVQHVAVRSLGKFFQLPKDIPSCDSVSHNFGYNLWYFQINYAILLVLTVVLAMQIINCQQFNLEVYLTVIVMAIVCLLNNVGYQARALGRKIKLSEQLSVIFLVMTVCNGLLPEAFDFIFFFGAYLAFVFVHASIIQVHKSYLKTVIIDV